MEELKKPAELCEPDSRNHLFSVLDPDTPEGIRPLTVEDQHQEMAALELPAGIPERLASAFAVARNLWLYGWFHWPFYALAGFHAFRCMEAALRTREAWEHDSGRLTPKAKGRRPLSELLHLAVKTEWVTDNGFEHFRKLDARRRSYESSLVEIGWLDEPVDPEPNEYSALLSRNIPVLRNTHAHADAPLAVPPGSTRLDLELARDLIVQATGGFGDPTVRGTREAGG